MPVHSPDDVTAEDLLQFPLFDEENRDAVEWIARQMTARTYETGDMLVREGDAATEFMVILDGEVHFRRSGSEMTLVAPRGQATGLLPFSRMKTWGGRGWAAQPTRIAFMDAAHLRELVYRAPIVAQRLVSQMTDRAREFTRMEESSNRLLAMGKLAAGLAHELNNPASAAVRSSARLRDVLTERRKQVLVLRNITMSAQANALMAKLGDRITECAGAPETLDAVERSDRESELGDWLESIGAPAELAPELVDAGLASADLAPLSALVESHTVILGLRILVADHEILCLTRELEEASRRISELVQAVKSYSYMDASPVTEIDVEQGIEVTLRMFQHQLKHGIQVKRQFAGNLPKICANGSELNQVWTNLIDNALDAMEGAPPVGSKQLLIKTCAERERIVVEIGDNGPGIPVEVQRRIFEPFFTTKPVGEGTGLGLDIVQRIIRNHKGSIRVESKPGRTVFQVQLPMQSESEVDRADAAVQGHPHK